MQTSGTERRPGPEGQDLRLRKVGFSCRFLRAKRRPNCSPGRQPDDSSGCRPRGSREGANVTAREWYRAYVGCRAPCLRNEPAAHRPIIPRSRAPRRPGRRPVSCVAFLNERKFHVGKADGFPSGVPRKGGAGRTRRRRPSSGRGELSTRTSPRPAEGRRRAFGFGTRRSRRGAQVAPRRERKSNHHGRLPGRRRPVVAAPRDPRDAPFAQGLARRMLPG